MNDFIKWLLITGIIALVTERISILFRDLRRFKSWRRAFMFLHPLVLTLFALFVFNSSLFYNGEAELSLNLNIFSRQSLAKAAKDYLDSNFVLIDNSADRTSIPLGVSGKATIDITNRKDIAQLLAMLNQLHNDLDLVVVDMDFDNPDKINDSPLKNEFKILADAGKLLMSGPKANTQLTTSLPDSIFGRTSEAVEDDKFSYHQIVANDTYSLPYLIYKSLDSVQPQAEFWGFLFERKISKGTAVHLNAFLPELLYLGEPIMVPKDSLFEVKTSKRSWKLEDLSQPEHIEVLKKDLKQRKSDGLKNVVFIGDFAGTKDIHRTTNGELPGPIILYNILYNLHTDTNRLNIWVMIAWYIACLIICWLMVWDALLVHRKTTAEHMLPVWLRKTSERLLSVEHMATSENYGKRMLGLVGILLIENAYLLFLIIVFILVRSFTGIYVNGLWLLYYIVIFKKILTYFSIRKNTPEP